jgi:hypothetical protein
MFFRCENMNVRFSPFPFPPFPRPERNAKPPCNSWCGRRLRECGPPPKADDPIHGCQEMVLTSAPRQTLKRTGARLVVSCGAKVAETVGGCFAFPFG